MSQVQITVDNESLTAETGSLLIDLLIKHEIKVPYFCYHEALGADGNCRMCMVEIEGQKRPQIACDTLVKEGMIVRTKGENIDGVRRNILELELINHPVDCPVCDQAGECKLQDFYMDHGLYDSKIDQADKVHHRKHVDLGSNVMLDQERCVLCARCTRFTDKITGTHELGIIGRGDHACVSTMPGKKLDNPYAMNVVDLCPVGALTSKDFRFAQRVWFLTSTPSVCHGCAKGCNIFIDHNREKYKDDRIYRFRPRENSEVNGHFICDAGRLSYKTLQENRQLESLVSGEVVEQDKAVTACLHMVEANGEKIVMLADANLYTEELEAIQKFADDLGAKLYAPMACYADEDFGDDWLRSSQRAANAKAVEELGIATDIPEDEPIGLLINFNHPDADALTADACISFQTHQAMNAGLILPLATFSESSGSLSNEDGVEQFCAKAVYRNEPVPTVSEWIDLLQGVSR
ncbi:MAG: 2Fe-2S iron-sulfur cluster-binding protein [Campylobacterota bacterium]|nr:2Fe-2S iron-sulfur cluster-binding protein [Campylobacterota bacterium]